MKNVLKSELFAWMALVVVIAVLCVTFSMRTVWWAYIDIFCAFMMVFIHLMAVYLGKKLPGVGNQLDTVAFIFGALMIVSFAVEWAMFQ